MRHLLAALSALTLVPAFAPSALASDWMDDKPDAPKEKRAPAEDPGTSVAEGDKKMKFGADLAFVLPVGDWSDVTGIGLGALLRFEVKLAEQVSFTARAGYIGHLEKNGLSTNEIPLIFPGIKVHFGGAYLGAELGLLSFGAKLTLEDDFFGGGTVSDSEMKFGMTVGFGYEISDVDLRLQLFAPSLADIGDLLGIMVNVGYTFVRF